MPVRTYAMIAVCAALGAVGCASAGASAGMGAGESSAILAPQTVYRVYVGAESADLLHRIRFGPEGLAVEKTIPAGELAVETEGPHGLVIGPRGEFLYVTTGHGLPDGKAWKYALGPDTLAGEPVPLGFFPATIDVAPDGLYAFAVNANFHGEMVPSTISVLYTPTMVEVARTTTCTMPHGSRLNPSGTRHYSGCMMDDQLVEIDTRTFEVSRRFDVSVGGEAPIPVAPGAVATADHAAHAAGNPSASPSPTCSPTWAQPSVDGEMVYVACNRADHILEIDVSDWAVSRTFRTGDGPYNLAVMPDGAYLLATLKSGAAVALYDLATGRIVATSPTSTTLAHGVVVSPDSRYAFVTSEGVGGEPGMVDVFALPSLQRVGSIEVGKQAAGIAFWRMEAR